MVAGFVYALRSVEGLALFLLVGTSIPTVIVGMQHYYTRSVNLTEISLNVPQVSQLTFVVSNDSRRTAWVLFVEVSTRISTQPLGEDEGFVREALSSLYALFGRTRELLTDVHPSSVGSRKSVEHLALAMLNLELRPFLSKWHPLLTRFEQYGDDEAAWEHNASFRAELEQMRLRLLDFALSFAKLAGVSDPQWLLRPRSI